MSTATEVTLPTAAIKTTTGLLIPYSRIQVLDNYQVREGGASPEHIDELYVSIGENGQETAVWVLKVSNAQFTQKHPTVALKEGDDQYVLIAGFSRMAAIQKGIEAGKFDTNFAVRCEVKYKGFMSEAEQILFSTSENLNREPMTPVQIGRIVKRLIALNIPQKTIATRLGLSQPQVSQYGAFVVEADMDTQQLVENGEVSFSAATAAVKAGLTGEGLKEIVAESQVAGTKVTAEKVLAKAGQQSALQAFKNLIKEVERENMRIVGNGKQYTSNEMFVLFWDILSGDTTAKEVFAVFNPANAVKEVKAPKGVLIPQKGHPNAVGFNGDGEEE